MAHDAAATALMRLVGKVELPMLQRALLTRQNKRELPEGACLLGPSCSSHC